MWYEKAIHEFWISCPPGVPADLKQERKPVRRPGGFEIRRKKNVLTFLGSADLKSAASKLEARCGGLQIPRF